MAALWLVVAPTVAASAHSDDQSYLYLDFGETLVARLQMPFGDIEEALGIEIGGDDAEIDEAIELNQDALRIYAADHFDVGTTGTFFDKQYLFAERFGETNHVEVAFRMSTGAAIPDQLDVRLDPFFDEIPGRGALLIVANDWQRGVFDNEASQLLGFDAELRQDSVTLGDASQWKNFTTSVGAGLDHIRTGPDHMLFIVALVLPAVLVWRAGWEPATGFGSSLWRVTKILTMFTLAHSVTFTLAGIGAVPTPTPRVTESIIALSIAATALHNLRPVFREREWLIAFIFGLFHGFGFASLVQSLDVNLETQLISLAGRNIGIELGQLVVVFLVFPALFLLRVTRLYLPLMRVSCILLIIASIGWIAERLFDAPTFTSVAIDKALLFPRILIFVALGTAFAAFWYQRERSAGRLVEPADRPGADHSPEPATEGERAPVLR